MNAGLLHLEREELPKSAKLPKNLPGLKTFENQLPKQIPNVCEDGDLAMPQ
jgi:hypothetical protein